MGILPGVLDASDPAMYYSNTPEVRVPVVAPWQAHLDSLVTAIHEMRGLGKPLSVFNVDRFLWSVVS